MGKHYLEAMFSPKSIAVFGASEQSVGGRIYQNILDSGFSGPLFAVNPKHETVFGRPCVASLADLNEPVELAVIATPAATVPGIMASCGEHGARAAIVVSAGFSESAGAGANTERAMLDAARLHGIRILGPNCLGLIRPAAGMNATFSKNAARPGRLALVSQSGALCTAILDWAAAREIGFSAIVSVGDSADVDFGDILDFLAQDAETDSILMYVEGVRDARRFMSGLRIAARMKPVVAIKSGRHPAGAQAALTHTAAMVGGDDVFDAALRRAGVVRVASIEQLFDTAQLLASRHRTKGNRLAIVTNGGGPGVMAVDRAIDFGIDLAPLGEETMSRLDAAMPAHWSHANPVDILGDASATHYGTAVAACLDDPQVDGVLVMLTPQATTDVTACADAVIEARGASKKPVLACWMGDGMVAEAKQHFAHKQLPTFGSPESSVEAFSCLVKYHRNQMNLMQVPASLSPQNAPDQEGAQLIIESVLAERRNTLTTIESKAVLCAFGIPVTPTLEATSANAALVAAESLGFPLVMKIASPDITHKSDTGGVRLNVASAANIRRVYQEMMDEAKRRNPDARITGVTLEPMHRPPHGRELLLGVLRDPVFGPTITFGAGGTHAELTRDRAVALPPLNKHLAQDMIAQTRIAKLLAAYRDVPAIDAEALIDVLQKVSEMACQLPAVTGLDINPLVADENGVIALDARITVAHQAPSLVPYAHMAIHPYPRHLISRVQLADATDVTIRPIRPEDAAIEEAFVNGLSPQSKYFRFMCNMNELSHDMLIRFTQLDFQHELALIAVIGEGPDETEIGVARYSLNPDGETCEFALVVGDQWHAKGLGTQLMAALMRAARERGYRQFVGDVLADNTTMLSLMTRLGFDIRACPDDPGVRIVSRML